MPVKRSIKKNGSKQVKNDEERGRSNSKARSTSRSRSRSTSRSPKALKQVDSHPQAPTLPESKQKITKNSKKTVKNQEITIKQSNIRSFLSKLPSEARFILYVAVLYLSFIYWGYLQEKITTTKYWNRDLKVTYTWNYPFALNFLMAISSYSVAYCLEVIGNVPRPYAPLNLFFKAALTAAIASPIGYTALKYISFPLMILTKSSKPVPVMLIGILFYKRKFPLYKYVSVLLICGGISLFSYYAKKYSPPSNSMHHDHSNSNTIYSMIINNNILSEDSMQLLIGIVLVLMNLTLDGYTNNEQDMIFDKYKATSFQMMKFTNLWQIGIIFVYLALTTIIFGYNSEVFLAYEVILNCLSIRYDILLFCICACIGQVAIFAVMEEFGSLAWITISITRKLFTILVSVFMFNHSVNMKQWLGIVAVFSGMILEVSMNYNSKEKKEK